MTFLARLGERCDREARLYVLGGSALRLLGSPRETLDVDYTPYSIALSKITRGFESDLEDVLFLLRTGTIAFQELEMHFRAILPRVAKVDIDPKEFQAYFFEISRRRNQP